MVLNFCILSINISYELWFHFTVNEMSCKHPQTLYQHSTKTYFSCKHGHSSRTDTIIFGPLFSAGGPAVSPLSVSPSVSLSVCNFSQIFLILCMLLEVNNCQNPTESDFLGKFLFVHIWAKGTNNGPRRGFILFSWKYSRMKGYSICCLPQTPHLAEFSVSSYFSKYSRPMRIQDFS